ncbi:MAG: hypothetical protein ACXABV_07680 [Candidatus Thorarchaeota archaeon]
MISLISIDSIIQTVMLLSGLIGVLFGRYRSYKRFFLLIALAIGFVVGLCGHLGLVYPFFIYYQIYAPAIPGYIDPYGFYFLHPNYMLFEFTVGFGSIPLIVSVAFVSISIVGVLIGYLIGHIRK